MKYITSIIKKIFLKELPKPIGRWRIENCNKILNSKIDLSDLTSFFSMGLAGKILVSKGNKKALAS